MYRRIVRGFDTKTRTGGTSTCTGRDTSGPSKYSVEGRKQMRTSQDEESPSPGATFNKTPRNDSDIPKMPKRRSLNDDSFMFLVTSTGGIPPSDCCVGSVDGISNDSVDLTLFIDEDEDDYDYDLYDDDQSSTTELFPILRLSSVDITIQSTKVVVDKSRTPLVANSRWLEPQQGAHPLVEGRKMCSLPTVTMGRRPTLRRTHSGGLDAYLRPPPRFTRFEI